MLLTGSGLDLRFGDGRVIRLAEPAARADFAGERRVVGAPTLAATTQLNLMWCRDAWTAATTILRGPRLREITLGAGEVLAWFVVDGLVEADGVTAHSGDTLVADDPPWSRVGWDGTVIEMRLSPHPKGTT